MKPSCPHAMQLHDFLADELSPAGARALEEHVANCACCQQELLELRTLRGRLLSIAEAEPSPELTTSILNRVQLEARRTPSWPQFTALAASIALCFGGAWMFFRPEINPPAQRPLSEIQTGAVRGLEWLARVQESDGSWSAERWGGQRVYSPALSALPLMAVVSNEGALPQLQEASERGARHLLAAQQADGTFGPEFRGAPYNHSIATLALLRVRQKRPALIPPGSLERAISALVTRQLPNGSWGYHESPTGDRSITQWHVLALDLAASLGWQVAHEPAQRGLLWLAQQATSPADSAEPEDSTSAVLARVTAPTPRGKGALDLYDAFFQIAALRSARDADAGDRLARLQRDILRQQTVDGEQQGSWPPADQWSRAGGRLYATALAALSLTTR